MCKIVEDYANESKLDNIRSLFENGCALDVVIASFATISEDVIRKIYQEVAETKTIE